jgi:tRNA dimethylallyltransferase
VDATTRVRVPHHLLDLLDPTEPGSAGRHASLAEGAVREIAARRRVPILAGGTGLYFRALFRGLVAVTIPRDEVARIRASFAGRTTGELHGELTRSDPARAAAISPNDRVRVTRALEIIAYTGTSVTDLYARPRTAPADIDYLKFVLTMPRERLRESIARRTRALFAQGWVEEVRRLLAAGLDSGAPAMNSVGYAEIVGAIERGDDPYSCLDRVITLTQQYAKRQETFFRAEPGAVRVDVSRPGAADEVSARVREFLRRGAPQ